MVLNDWVGVVRHCFTIRASVLRTPLRQRFHNVLEECQTGEVVAPGECESLRKVMEARQAELSCVIRKRSRSSASVGFLGTILHWISLLPSKPCKQSVGLSQYSWHHLTQAARHIPVTWRYTMRSSHERLHILVLQRSCSGQRCGQVTHYPVGPNQSGFSAAWSRQPVQLLVCVSKRLAGRIPAQLSGM